jgi:hypothetical protein
VNVDSGSVGTLDRPELTSPADDLTTTLELNGAD